MLVIRINCIIETEMSYLLFLLFCTFAINLALAVFVFVKNPKQSKNVVFALFGIGTAVSPLIIICVLAGWFSGKIKTRALQYRMMFQRMSGVILILLGVFSAIS